MVRLFPLSRFTRRVGCKKKPVVLLVIDGFGIAPPSEGNAVVRAKTPHYDRFLREYPHGELIAAGESVGLPANEAGNSEVGHLTIGVGRTIPQSLVRINQAIDDGTFFDNEAFWKASQHVREHSSTLHIMGLVGSGEVHSSTEHFYALVDYCKQKDISRVKYHLFTDGRDAPPRDAIKVFGEIEQKLRNAGVGQIATISGRYFAMDRDRRWERTKKAYDAIVLGRGVQQTSAMAAIQASYGAGQTDEFLEPAVITFDGQPVGAVQDNDAVISFNFRIDRPRQISMAFVLEDFERLKSFELEHDPYKHTYDKKGTTDVVSGPTFQRERWPKNLFFVSMTEYQKTLPVSSVAFPPHVVDDSLAELLSKSSKTQLHLAESEKERMVTFYFDGMKDVRYSGEEVIIVPSPKVATYDKKPEMSLWKVVHEFQKQIDRCEYDFFVMNFANPDMVAHSGKVEATIKAIEQVDKALGEMEKAILSYDGVFLITADHGNSEEMLRYPTTTFFYTSSKGEVNTEHSSNPVPLLIIGKQFRGKGQWMFKGSLADVAPTILSLFGLAIPEEMTGKNLLETEAVSTP